MSGGPPSHRDLREGARAAGTAGPTLKVVDERAALERTLLALLPRVRAQLFRMLGPRATLEDAVQDTLIELAQALPRFEGRSSVESFARTITLRVGYRYYARTEPRDVLDPELQPAHAPLADEELAQRRALMRLHRCLARLPKKRRTAFVLCVLEELSAKEAAELVGTSAGSMRALVMHARDELTRMLATIAKEDGRG
jgi:RNA polymerase sigma-70 factor (ECF subfamily)